MKKTYECDVLGYCPFLPTDFSGSGQACYHFCGLGADESPTEAYDREDCQEDPW